MAGEPVINIVASQWRLVEVGRVVLFTHGQYTGQLAVIVEIIDHKRVCSDLRFDPFTGGWGNCADHTARYSLTGPRKRVYLFHVIQPP